MTEVIQESTLCNSVRLDKEGQLMFNWIKTQPSMQRSLKKEIALSRSLFQRNLRPEACNPADGNRADQDEGDQRLACAAGKRDVLKAIHLLPGIKPAGDGNSGFYV